MAKKLSLLLAAVAVVAFAIPAAASASEITEGGIPVPVRSFITGTSTNTVTKTSLGNLTCASVVVNGELDHNSGGLVEATKHGVSTGSTCELGGTHPVTVKSIVLKSLTSSTTGAGTIGVSFEAELPTVTCKFSSTSLPFTYAVGTSILVLTKTALSATPAACQPGEISGSFAMSTTAGGAITLS